jgi:glycine/D-amino acid oxidase-like deaminating enzyme
MASADISAPDFKDAPYWWEAAPPSKAAVPALPDCPEVAIVGAGYCGLSAALELRRHGVGVLVVDAARIGHAASSLKGGVVAVSRTSRKPISSSRTWGPVRTLWAARWAAHRARHLTDAIDVARRSADNHAERHRSWGN